MTINKEKEGFGAGPLEARPVLFPTQNSKQAC
jgi:hypothetical protein